MTAKEYLSQYQDLKKDIAAQEAKLEELRALAEKSVPSTEGGGIGIISDRVGNGAAKIVDLEREINQEKDYIVYLMIEIEDIIDEVKNSRLSLLLTLRYIRGYTHEKTAEKMALSVRHEGRLHKKALSEVEKILSKADKIQ